MTDPPILRRGTGDDSYAAMAITEHAITNYSRQWGLIAPSAPLPDKAQLDATWGRTRPLYEFLSANADQWWVAEERGQVVAFARSLLCDGLRELTELFVHPEAQGVGIGRQLLSRAFPADGARHRAIISTIDPGAQMLYMATGVYPRFPLRGFARAPEKVQVDTDLVFSPATDTQATLDAMDAIDDTVLGHRRARVHRWLLGTRKGFLCRRGASIAGYGYVGKTGGPFAALEPADLPAILAHAECGAAEEGFRSFYLLVPLVNAAAIGHMAKRRYEMDRMVLELMMDEPFGRFDRYLAASVLFL